MAIKIEGKIISSKGKKTIEKKKDELKNNIGAKIYWFDGPMYDLWEGVIIGENEEEYKVNATLQHIYKNPNKIPQIFNMKKGDILFEKKK